MNKPIKSFMQLNAWKASHDMALSVYAVSKSFPDEEKFGLTSQIRRAAISAASNIAEGFSRKTGSDRGHFYRMSLSSITETQAQLLLAKDLKFIDKSQFDKVATKLQTAQKILFGLIKATK